MIRSITMAAILLGSSPAAAETLYMTYSGVVTSAGDNLITARNPDGTTVTFTGGSIPDYPVKVGQSYPIQFAFDAPTSAQLASTACGGRFSLSFSGGGCNLATIIRTPAGPAGFGGFLNSDPGFVVGVDIVTQADGSYRADVPTGQIGFKYAFVQPFVYNPTTGQLLFDPALICPNLLSFCPNGEARGTLSNLILGPIGVAGISGTDAQGRNTYYNAGTAGNLAFSGSFSNPNANPIPVPAPGVAGLFGLGAAWLIARRRRIRVATGGGEFR